MALYSGIDWSRRERRHSEKQESMDVSEHAVGFTPKDEDPRVAWLYKSIGRLEPLDRSLMLLVLEGLSYREMAQTLGITQSNVGAKISRIKQALSQQSEGADSHEL